MLAYRGRDGTYECGGCFGEVGRAPGVRMEIDDVHQCVIDMRRFHSRSDSRSSARKNRSARRAFRPKSVNAAGVDDFMSTRVCPFMSSTTRISTTPFNFL